MWKVTTLSKFVLTAILLGMLGMMAEPAHAVDIEDHPEYLPQYHPRFGVIALDEEVRAAIEEFPDVASCLKPDAIQNGVPDLDAIDWHKIRNDGDAKVCLFMIFEQLGDPESVNAWLGRMNFKPSGPFNDGGISLDQTRYLGLEDSVLTELRVISVTARHSLEGQYPIFPTHGVWKYLRRFLSTAQSVGVLWLPDGRLIDVSIFYDSPFN